eukprot:481880_1
MAVKQTPPSKIISIFVLLVFAILTLFYYIHVIDAEPLYLQLQVTTGNGTRQFDQSSLWNTNSSILIFNFTCQSFEELCSMLQLQHIYNFSEFKNKYNSIVRHLNDTNLSQLFILSFRRELVFMFTQYDISIPEIKSAYKHIFVSLYDRRRYMNSSRQTLHHTHISKSLGTMLRETSKRIGKRHSAKFHPHGKYIFKGRTKSDQYIHSGSFQSCKWLDIWLRRRGFYRTESEAPLSLHVLCPQMHNSIVLREPISHRLSMLAFQNLFEPYKGAIYCNITGSDDGVLESLISTKLMYPHKPTNRYIKHTVFGEYMPCFSAIQMKGIINLLLNQSNIGREANEYRIKHHEYIPNVYKSGVSMEWIDPRNKTFGIGVIDPMQKAMNTSFVVGLLTNTYVRWIGYKHQNKYRLTDAIYEDYDHINQYHLDESKRILMQYDYVLPSDETFPATSDIWMFYLKELHRIMTQIKSIQTFNDMMDNGSIHLVVEKWPTHLMVNHHRRLCTNALRDQFTQSGEIVKLQQYNKLDIQLHQFAQKIALADNLFYEIMTTF